MRVALAQVTSTADLDANLAIIASCTAEAAAAGAALVVFPEAMMRCFGAPLQAIAQPLNGPWPSAVRAIAREHNITVIVGMFTPADDGRVRNTLLVAGPSAGADAQYNKIHLFDAFGFAESHTVKAGTGPVVVEVAGTSIGLATCYDVRFPGLFTELARRGAEAMVVCASWGAGPGKVEQWELLTRARALDSTSFVLAAGQAEPPAPPPGEPAPTAPTGVGRSAVISPWGDVVAALGAEPGLLIADLDLADVARARAALPVLANARW